MLYFQSKVFPITFKEFLSVFFYGFRMDASMAGYICALPLLFFIVQWIFPFVKIPNTILKYYSWFILVISSLIMAVNLNIYQEWGTKLPYRAISTLMEYPYEAYISASTSPFLIPFLLFLFIITTGWYLFKQVIDKPEKTPNPHWYLKIPVSLLLIGSLFFAIRSGLQTTPLNPSMAYFSTIPILNHTSVNTEWNLLSDYLHNEKGNKNPYEYEINALAQEQIAPYLNTASTPVSVLTREKPNVILIILESFTSDLVAGLGGEKGIAPHFDKLIENGLTFPNFYATSDRTDKGMIAIMSGFPSQATKSIIKNVNKSEKLPAIGQEFLANGYKTSFFHGGESAFYNFKSYMLSHGIEEVIDQKNFPRKDVLSKWGAFDHLTFKKQIDYLNKSEQPFFSTLLTLSNHEPFDLPGEPKFGSKNVADLFRSTAFYTDSALNVYLTDAKKTNWYKNTLFVIVADHGHRLPLEKWDSFHPNRYRIPFILYGDVLKEEYKGRMIDKIGGQVDLASTVLGQLKMDSKAYYWSKDLLATETPSFAFFTWDDGFGVVKPEQSLTFDNVGKNVIFAKKTQLQDSTNHKIEKIGRSYLQEVYRQYLNY